MPFSNQFEAKQFLVDKVIYEAQLQGAPLSEMDRRLLLFSVDEPQSATGIPVEVLEDVDDVWEANIIRLLQAAYKKDHSNIEERRKYRDALVTLKGSDNYILVMVDRALPRSNVIRDLVLYVVIALLLVAYVLWRAS
jgi:hypothetical protein